MSKKVLGRGLDALIPEAVPLKNEPQLEIDIHAIAPNEHQPRLEIKEESLKELAASIRENGIVQPVLVRKWGSSYQLVAGERRWRAARMAGLLKIPAVVREIPESRMLELALVENLQREDLNLIEQAKAYQKLNETLALNQEAIAQRVGKDRSSVANVLRLLKLPESIQHLLSQGKLSFGHAKILLGLESETEQEHIAEKIISKNLTVREIENLIRRTPKRSRLRSKSIQTDANTARAEDTLRHRLATKVKIKRARKGGRIEIDFYSEDDLQRIYVLILGNQPAQANVQAN